MNHLTLTPSEATRNAIFRLIISGGRRFEDKRLLYRSADHLLSQRLAAGDTIVIVHGNNRRFHPRTKQELPTADQLARQYAYDRGYTQRPFNAQWTLYGKKAGPLRNQAMADYGHALLAFWNKKSPGTGNMITLALRKGLPVRQIIVAY